ncbi:flippase [Thermodesulfobacteriota bacterium]
MGENKKERDSNLTNVALGGGITFAGVFLGGGLQYFYHILLARYLGPDDLGVFVLGLAIIGIASSFSRLGLDSGILKYVPIYRVAGDTARVKGIVTEALKLGVIAGVLVSALIVILSPTIAKMIFGSQEHSPLLKILSLAIPFLVLMPLLLSTFQAFHIARYSALIPNFIFPLLNILFTVFALIIGWRLKGIAFVYLIVTIFSFSLAGYYFFKLFPEIRKGPHGVIKREELLKYSLSLFGVSFLVFLIMWTDTLMIGFFKSSKEVGIYSVAVKTSVLLSIILNSLNFIFAPVISELYNNNDIKQLERIFKTVARWGISLAFPLFLIMAFWSKEILSLFGVGFISASIPLIILALGQFVAVGTGSVGNMLFMTGGNMIVLIYVTAAFFVNLLLNYLLIPPYGIIGAAIATSTSISLINILCLITVSLLLKIHPYSTEIFKPVLTGISVLFLTMLAVQYADFEWLGTLLLSSVIFMIFYFSVFLLFCLNDEDKETFRDVKNRARTILIKPT